MKLTPAERETIILYDEAGDTANVYTYDHKLIEKLKQLHKKHPDQIVVRQIKRCSIRQIILGRFRFVAELSVTLKVSVSANCFLELKSPAN